MLPEVIIAVSILGTIYAVRKMTQGKELSADEFEVIEKEKKKSYGKLD
jgi:hypothetical protein